ncbi:MAG: DNA polymerase III subunit delta [Candidatus Wildermuthbacteria bacterium]|nr:DNA polymerase III subunit delta [Candidatus Wildermuthbacteria bacterium]
MLIFLYGSDTLRASRKIQEIKEGYLKANRQGHNLRFFDCSAVGEEDMKRELEAVSLFKEKKLLILKNPLANRELSDLLRTMKKHLEKTEDLLVFWEEGLLPKSNAFCRFLLEHAKTQEFSPLSRASLKQWVLKEFRKHHTAIGEEALDFLVKSEGDDMWKLSSEIQKLAAFAFSLGFKVSLANVQSFIRVQAESDIFSTIDALASSNRAQALQLLFSRLQRGESPLYLLSMIAYQFRNLLEIKDALDKKLPLGSLSLHPFVLKKGQAAVSRFSFERLKEIYGKIIDADCAIKTGERSPGVRLSLLAASL